MASSVTFEVITGVTMKLSVLMNVEFSCGR